MVAAGVPGAAFSRDPSAVAFGRVERLTDRVWLVVERDDDAPVFLYVVVGASRVLLVDSGAGQGRTRERNSQLQRLLSRPFSTRFG